MSAEIIPVIFIFGGFTLVAYLIIKWIYSAYFQKELPPTFKPKPTVYYRTIELTLFTNAGKETYCFGKYEDDYTEIIPLENDKYKAFVDWYNSDISETWTPHLNCLRTATFSRSSILYFKTAIITEKEWNISDYE